MPRPPAGARRILCSGSAGQPGSTWINHRLPSPLRGILAGCDRRVGKGKPAGSPGNVAGYQRRAGSNADPVRAAVVDIIDVRQWHYRADGSLYAPPGGVSLAPRQHARIMEPGESNPGQVYRSVRELRARFPAKAVVYSSRGGPGSGWAELMAGGSFPNIPPIGDDNFLLQAAAMKPMDVPNPAVRQWTLARSGYGYIVYVDGPEMTLDLAGDTVEYVAKRIDPATERVTVEPDKIRGGRAVTLSNRGEGAVVIWLARF